MAVVIASDLGKDIDFDPAAAKDLLKQAGYADPSQFPALRFRFATNSANQTRAEFIQAQLKQIRPAGSCPPLSFSGLPSRHVHR